MFHFMNFVRPFVNYAIFRELCDWMRFEVDCAKSHHRVISEGLSNTNKFCSAQCDMNGDSCLFSPIQIKDITVSRQH